MCAALVATLALLFVGCGGGGGGTPAAGGTPPATLMDGDTIVFTFDDGSGALNITITGGGSALDYTITGAAGPDSGVADAIWGPPSGSNVAFQTNNIVSGPSGPLGSNTWDMVFNTNTAGTAADTMAAFGPSAFVYTPAPPFMAPAVLAAGNTVVFAFVGGGSETYAMTSPTAFNYSNTPGGQNGTGTSTYTPSGASSTFDVSVGAPIAFTDTFTMTWTSASGGTFTNGAAASGNFTFTP